MVVNLKNKNINLKIAIPVVMAGIIGAIIGAKLSVNMQINKLKTYFGIFLIIIGIYEIYSLKNEYINHKKKNNKSIK